MPKPHAPKPPYPAQFRQQMVELVHAGRKPAELAKEFNCHVTSILSWVRKSGGIFRLDRTGVASFTQSASQAATHCAGLAWSTASRMKDGALTSKLRNWLIACVLALTALRRATLKIRKASARPLWALGRPFWRRLPTRHAQRFLRRSDRSCRGCGVGRGRAG